MQRFAIRLAFFIALSFMLTGCSNGPLFPNIKKGPPGAPHGTGINMPMATKPRAESSVNKLPQSIARFFHENNSAILGLLGIIFLWIYIRAYSTEKNRRYTKISKEEVGLLKIIRDNASRIWENHRPGRNVVRLEDWKENN